MQTTFGNVTILKNVTQLVADFDYLDIASLLHGISDALRQGYSLGDALEELGLDIAGITDGDYGLLPTIQDISDELELINLASVCTAHLMQSYSRA